MSAHMVGMTKILVAGDWHGQQNWGLRVLREASKAGDIQGILHVGDLAALWPSAGGPQTEDKFTRLLKKWLVEYDQTLWFADGNHDHHPVLRDLPLNKEGFGVISERLLYAPRGHGFNLGGKRIGFLGGALSIDRMHRVPGRTWWPEEELTAEEVDRISSGGPLDVMITHEVPAGITLTSNLRDPLPEELAYASYQQRLLVADAVANTKPQLVFSGHHHQRVTQRLAGTDTTVHVLDRDGQTNNCVVLDLADLSVTDFPLPVR